MKKKWQTNTIYVAKVKIKENKGKAVGRQRSMRRKLNQKNKKGVKNLQKIKNRKKTV